MADMNFVDKLSGYIFRAKSGNACFEHYQNHGIFEYPLIKWCAQFLNSKSTFVDVGAHMGTYSVILSKHCAKVHAFEAQSSTFNNLSAAVELNKRTNIEPHHMALGAKEDTVTLHQVSDDGGGSTVDQSVASHHQVLHTEIVPMNTLDSFKFTGVDLLKIDVEGYELEVIMGASHTLMENNFPPFIFESWNNEPWYQEKKDKLFEYVRALGYRVVPISGTSNMYLASNHPLRVPNSAKLSIYAAKLSAGLDMSDVPWEIMRDLAKHFRECHQHKLAYTAAVDGLAKLTALLGSEEDQEYGQALREEVIQSAQYLSDEDTHKFAYQCCEELILGKHHDWELKNGTLDRQVHYMKPLNSSSILPINPKISAEYTPSSSALVRIDNGFRINVRGVNYYINKNGGYTIRDSEGIVRTRNYLITLNNELQVQGEPVELVDNSGVVVYPIRIRGMEDVRLFGDNQFMCTRLDVNPQGIPQMCYGEYEPHTGSVTKILPLKVTEHIQCEKNWMPFIKDGQVYFIHTVFPLKLYQLDRDTGATTLVPTTVTLAQDQDLDLSSFRGSGGVIPYNNGWLGSIHQVHHDTQRKYFHRLVWFDQEFTTMKYSRIFFFDSPNIEFSLSMCLTDTDLLIPYSFRDNSSRISILPLEELDAMLE